MQEFETVLVIPDDHGRGFWKEFVKGHENEMIVFLGDYVDPYPHENISVEVLYNEEDFWLTQKSMSKLFNVEVNTINYHLKEIFKSEELNEESVIRKIRITGSDRIFMSDYDRYLLELEEQIKSRL